ncbi:hypothetical protein Lser_V15G15959 [Lactuca serriola]
MTSSHSPSSSQDPTNPTPILLAAPPQTSTASSRRLPPPCWSQDETAALIDAYRDKWYSLRRGNLRASHWQEVADDVANRCPLSSGIPQKTSIQCRHKMEKLRKRYRAEIQRAAATPKGHRYPSSWVHFKRMDLMEKGSSSSDPDAMNQDEDDEEEGDRDVDNQDGLLLYPRGIKQAIPLPPHQRFYSSIDNGTGHLNGNENGFRIKIPGRANTAAVPPPSAGMNMYNNNNSAYDDYPPPVKSNYGLGKGLRDGYAKGGFGIGKDRGGGIKRREEVTGNSNNPVEDMVTAIKMLGDGFMRIERMKMDMARELESMRMEMEMKRTEMILDSQQRLVDSFSKAVFEKNKKLKRMPTPES